MSACQTCGCPLEPDFVGCPQCGEPAPPARTHEPPPVDRSRSTDRERGGNLGQVAINSGPGAGTSYRLGAVTDIGRSTAGNQIVLEDKFVGRQHGRIRLEDGKFVYYDLGSLNGSWVVPDGGARRPVRGSAALQDGDQLAIGEHRLVFRELER